MSLEIKPLVSETKEDHYMVMDIDNMRMFVGDLDNSLDTFNLWNKGQSEVEEVDGVTFEFEFFEDEE